jgi:hypothetical protein
MGISFYFSGTISHLTLIPSLAAELADICQSLRWRFCIISEPNVYQLNGIQFIPLNADPVFLTFLPNGRLCWPRHLSFQKLLIRNALIPEEFYAKVETQQAGPAVHMYLIKLFRFLQGKYFSEFRLIDEGDYWETSNEVALRKHFEHYDPCAHQLKIMVRHIQQMPEGRLKDLATRLKDGIGYK